VGETAENQRKTREKTKVAENQVFWLDFCAKRKVCAYPLKRKMQRLYKVTNDHKDWLKRIIKYSMDKEWPIAT
jgi:hypothetical protein